MASIDYLPAHRLRRLVKDLRVCADALHKQLDETKRQCALIEEVMREIRRQTSSNAMTEIPLVTVNKAKPSGRPELRVVSEREAETHSSSSSKRSNRGGVTGVS